MISLDAVKVKRKAESDDAEVTLLGSRTGARKGGRGKEERAPANAQYRICRLSAMCHRTLMEDDLNVYYGRYRAVGALGQHGVGVTLDSYGG
jgi:hypothetical protein